MPSADIRRMLCNQELASRFPLCIAADIDAVYEPLVLQTASEAIREEALPYFYCDDTFMLQAMKYNIEPHWKFLDEAGHYRHGEYVRALIAEGALSKCNGRISVETDDVPHWDNLVVWLSLAHAGKVVPLGSNGVTESQQAGRVGEGSVRARVAVQRGGVERA